MDGETHRLHGRGVMMRSRWLLVVALLLCVAAGPIQTPRAAKEKRRAAAPTVWDRMVAELFVEDAFRVVGPRATNVSEEQTGAASEAPPPKAFDRSGLMKTLAKAEVSIAQAISSEKTFKHQTPALNEQLERVVAIAAQLKDDDPDYRDDGDYQQFVRSMRASATALQVAVENASHEASGASFGRLKQACDACHGAFR